MSGENSDQPLGYDLWGEPVFRLARGRGRPKFEWTEENSHKVSMLLAMGWSNDRIAACIIDPRTGKNISKPTLKRYFRAELKIRDTARDMFFAKQLATAASHAFDGNVGAMRFLDKLVEKNDRMVAEAVVSRSPKLESKPESLGKKEINALDAAEADANLLAELEEEATGRARH